MTAHVAPILDVALFGAMERYGDLCMTAVIDLTRAFDRAVIEDAVRRTVEAFPVLGARYEKNWWRDRWVPMDGPVTDAVHFEPNGDLEARTEAWVRAPIDPTRERPIRVVVLERPTGVRLVLSLLHIAVDGAGVAAVGHVFGAHLYGVAPSLPTGGPRDIVSALGGLKWFHLPVLARGLVTTTLRPLLHWLAAPRTDAYPSEPGASASWRTFVIPPEEMTRTRERCGGATVNDVLVGVFARIAAKRSQEKNVVVSYTIDLRRYGKEARLVAANTSSVMSAILPRDALGTLERAVVAASEATRRDRDRLYGPALVLGPTLLGVVVPHGVARGIIPLVGTAAVDVPLDRGMAFTNVGRIDDGLRAFGDDIENIRIIGPRTTNTVIPVVVAFGFRGALHLEMYVGPGVGPEVLEVIEAEFRDAIR